LNAALDENIHFLLDTPNLYADTTAFGLDDPVRATDPDLRFNAFASTVEKLSASSRNILIDKLFIGTDFPCFWKPGERLGLYGYQAECMQKIFGNDFDETRMAENFLSLLPNDFVPIKSKIT